MSLFDGLVLTLRNALAGTLIYKIYSSVEEAFPEGKCYSPEEKGILEPRITAKSHYRENLTQSKQEGVCHCSGEKYQRTEQKTRYLGQGHYTVLCGQRGIESVCVLDQR